MGLDVIRKNVVSPCAKTIFKNIFEFPVIVSVTRQAGAMKN